MNLVAASVSPLQMKIIWYEEAYLKEAWVHLSFWSSQSFLAYKEQKHNLN